MANLLKMLWEYMDLTVLPFFETWSAHIFGGWQRVCWCTNEAFNQASPTKEFWENCPQKKGGHIYGKNEGWAYLRKLLYWERKASVEGNNLWSNFFPIVLDFNALNASFLSPPHMPSSSVATSSCLFLLCCFQDYFQSNSSCLFLLHWFRPERW